MKKADSRRQLTAHVYRTVRTPGDRPPHYTRLLGLCANCTSYNGEKNIILNAKQSQKNRDKALAAAKHNTNLTNASITSDTQLRNIAVACLKRPGVASLFEFQPPAFVYCFQWTAENEAGWSASDESLLQYEREESVNNLMSKHSVLLWALVSEFVMTKTIEPSY